MTEQSTDSPRSSTQQIKSEGIKLPPLSFISPFVNSSNATLGPRDNGDLHLPPFRQYDHPQLPSLDRLNEVEGNRPNLSQEPSNYDLPTPVHFGIDRRRQNVHSRSHEPALPYSASGSALVPVSAHKQQRFQHNHSPSFVHQHIQHSARGSHVHVVHEPHGDHVHEKVYIHQSEKEPADLNLFTFKKSDFKRRQVTFDHSEVFEFVKKFPQRHLGFVVYQQFPTSGSVMRSLFLEGQANDKSVDNNLEKSCQIVELLPACLVEYINCTIEVHVPFSAISDNENVFNRKIWGTDIYTDDSDIVSILVHCGIIEGEPPFESGSQVVPVTAGNEIDKACIKTYDRNSKRDIVATFLILPPLASYNGCFRNNYNSRSWDKPHNGASLALQQVRYLEIDSSTCGKLKKQSIKERLQVLPDQEPETSRTIDIWNLASA